MTIIAAMRESEDSILIGADSGQTEKPSGFRMEATKLYQHPGGPIVWGTAGSAYASINLFAHLPKLWLLRKSLTIG